MSRRDGAIYVGRLSKSTRTRDLEEIFEPYGRLLRCDIKYGTEMAYAFIDFEDRRDAEDCVKYEHGRELNGQSIIVEWAKGGKDRRMKRNDNNSSQSYDECFRCRRTGHWARDCPELRWGGRGGGRGGGGGGGGGGRWRSPSPRRRYSNRSRSRSRDRKRKSRSRSRDRRRRSRSNDKRSRSRSGDRKSRSLSGSQKSRSASAERKGSKSTSRDRKKSGSRSKSRSRSRSPPSKSGSKSKSRSKSPRLPSENHTEQQSNGADVVANVDEAARDGGDEGRASRSRSGSKD